VCGLVAAAGLVFGLSQLRGAGGHPPAMLMAFVPVLIVAGWVIVAMQPHGNWTASHAQRWSSDIGVLDVVRALGVWVGVLAFGIGATLAAVAEPFGRRRVARPAVDQAAADEPTAAERNEVAARERDETMVK